MTACHALALVLALAVEACSSRAENEQEPPTGDAGATEGGADAMDVEVGPGPGELGAECASPNECQAMLGACTIANPPLGCFEDSDGVVVVACLKPTLESDDPLLARGSPMDPVCTFRCGTEALRDTCTAIGGECHCTGAACGFEDCSSGDCIDVPEGYCGDSSCLFVCLAVGS